VNQKDRFAGIGSGNEFGMAKTSALQFIQQVRQEITKVTWPSRKETLITTGMVFVMAVTAAVFFLLVDQLLSVAIKFILGLGN
jgi:preprotein translocase subunit SecE